MDWILLITTHLYLARHWPKLIQAWCKVDAAMEKQYGYPKSFDKRIKVIFTVTVVISLSKLIEQNC